MEKLLKSLAIAGALLMLSLPATAADPDPRDQDIYGYQMMTAQERNEHRTKMRAAKTVEERERIRKEHHDKMVARAKERGLKMPDEPPAGRGPGSGPGPGPGGGRGPGGGGGGGR